ncbi:MAG: transcription repressor NadR [Saccharofermentans sp.]|nr:transcription repressor NadR [Saccharofermentans sp.]
MLTGNDRREKILTILSESDAPISATSLASRFGVSRQIIVGDIALIRAQGINVTATPRGYVIADNATDSIIRTIAVKHSDKDTALELNTIVDYGCKIIDVIVEHPLYGQISGQLQIASRFDVEQFIAEVKKEKAHSLSELTNGIHLHTIECPTEESYEHVVSKLKELGILLSE